MPLNPLVKPFIVVLTMVVLAADVLAGWEDTGAPARPVANPPAVRRPTYPQTRTAPRQAAPRQPALTPRQTAPRQPALTPRQTAPRQPAPAPRPRAAPPSEAIAPAQPGFVPPDLYSPFLDAPVEPLRWMSFMFIPGSEVAGSEDDLTMAEIAARLNLAEWRNVLSGDLDVDLRLKTVIFANDAEYEVMPTALIELPLELEWTWRFINGWSFQIGARPGIYADAEALGDGFGVPFKGAFYYAVTPEFSWLFGVEIRPGWDMIAIPLAGLAWEPGDYFRLTLAVPQTTALLQAGPIGLFGTVAWRNTTYGMSGDEGEPEQLTLDDFLLGGGLQIAFTESFHLTLEGGYLVNRSLTAEDSETEDELEIGSSPYGRVTLGGSF